MTQPTTLDAAGVAELLGGRVAGAPISWGVCEVPGWGHVLDIDVVLGEMAALGLKATELGPPGFLPDEPEGLRAALAGHDLTLVGGFLAVVLHDASQREASLAEAARACAQMAAAGGRELVLAAATGLDGYDERPELSPSEWAHLIETAGAVRDLAREHGLATTLHPHVGTHIEKRSEVEAFLRDGDVPICLDTGHLLIGGSDPLVVAQQHTARIAHVHLKDVNAAIADQVRAGAITYMQGVQQNMYVPLGQGDVPVGEIVRILEAGGYRGWYVLEQDTALADSSAGPAAKPKQDTAASLAHLAAAVAAG